MTTGSPYVPASAESIQRTIAALAARNVEAILVEDGAAALARLKELVPEGSEVFVNTSETLTTIGYTDFMHGNDRYVNLHDRMMAQPDPAEQREFRRQTTIADYFVGSVQAIAETGEIVVASGSGSQIGAYSYGARRLILVAGTTEDMLHRRRGRSAHPRLDPRSARPLARGPWRRPHSHRQVPRDGARAGCRSHHHAPHPRKPRLVDRDGRGTISPK